MEKGNLSVANYMTGVFDGIILPMMVCIIFFPIMADAVGQLPAIGLGVAVFGGIIYGAARYFGELEEIRHHHPILSRLEIEKEQEMLKSIGLDEELTDALRKQMEEERVLWLKEVRDNHLGWESEDKQRAFKSALQTGLGFFSAGLLCMLYLQAVLCFYTPDGSISFVRFLIFLIFPTGLLALFGAYKAHYTHRDKAKDALLNGLYGVTLFLVAFFIALFIERMKHA